MDPSRQLVQTVAGAPCPDTVAANMTPVVSVVIPTYNRADLVVQAVESVLGQTYRNFELIVVDDGSPDATEARLAPYRDLLTYSRQPNRGVNAARNFGISISRGRYVALLDDDDLWLPSKLDEQVRVLERHSDAGFVFSDFYILRSGGERIPRGLDTWHGGPPDWARSCAVSYRVDLRPDAGYEVRTGDIYAASLGAPYVLPSTALIRRSRMDAAVRLNESDSTCGDWEYFARLSRSSGAIFMDIETTLNRSHEDAVRLTRLPRALQLTRRIAMVRRTWKADADFYSANRLAVDDLERRLLADLALAHALDGDKQGSRQSLRERSRIPGRGRPRENIVCGLLRAPGGSALIRGVRTLRQRMSASP